MRREGEGRCTCKIGRTLHESLFWVKSVAWRKEGNSVAELETTSLSSERGETVSKFGVMSQIMASSEKTSCKGREGER